MGPRLLVQSLASSDYVRGLNKARQLGLCTKPRRNSEPRLYLGWGLYNLKEIKLA